MSFASIFRSILDPQSGTRGQPRRAARGHAGASGGGHSHNQTGTKTHAQSGGSRNTPSSRPDRATASKPQSQAAATLPPSPRTAARQQRFFDELAPSAPKTQHSTTNGLERKGAQDAAAGDKSLAAMPKIDSAGMRYMLLVYALYAFNLVVTGAGAYWFGGNEVCMWEFVAWILSFAFMYFYNGHVAVRFVGSVVHSFVTGIMVSFALTYIFAADETLFLNALVVTFGLNSVLIIMAWVVYDPTFWSHLWRIVSISLVGMSVVSFVLGAFEVGPFVSAGAAGNLSVLIGLGFIGLTILVDQNLILEDVEAGRFDLIRHASQSIVSLMLFFRVRIMLIRFVTFAKKSNAGGSGDPASNSQSIVAPLGTHQHVRFASSA